MTDQTYGIPVTLTAECWEYVVNLINSDAGYSPIADAISSQVTDYLGG